MKPFDYDKYLENNLLLKEMETEPTVEVSGTSSSQNTQKIEKFMKDNEVFINKIKLLVGSNPKILADFIDTLNQKITVDKKLRQTSDAQQAGKFLKKAAGKKLNEPTPPTEK